MQNTLSPHAAAVVLQSDIYATAIDINNVETAADVSPKFQCHHVDMASGKHGIANLILAILEESGAVFESGVANGAMRQIAIAGGMFSADIIAKVQSKFTSGTSRYPAATIAHNLSTVCGNGTNASSIFKNTIGKIRLTKSEDQESAKKGLRPRTVYFKISPVPSN